MSLIKNKEGKATRQAFGDEILELGKENGNIVVVDADIGGSCKTGEFMNELPQQHINVGIAEQNAAGMAAGLSTTGKIPFVSTYAVFGSLRMAEQVRQEVCYPNLNVKIACSHGGLTPATDGGSHQAIEDMGVLRTFPNMKVIMGADYYSTRKLIKAASEIYGPVYLRFTRGPIPIIYDEDETFEIGKAKHLKDGEDIAIIANGDTLSLAIEASEKLEEEGISVKLLDMHTIKPIDKTAILECIQIGKIITVEDHNIINGLGSAVSDVVAEEGTGKVRKIGVQDQFGQSAPYEKLLEINGITVENIINTAKSLVQK
ncbi:transketolase family protein [Staphylococcus xylosus]|uniref:transketolase family protein n=1 Tax=Staphylococcus TaxID=1279 RepID=UPI000D1EB1D8|nr:MULTISPECIES: transketolase C-terminal domain-containing protein [Staphylococcus]PTK47044.1 transketolase [Staphylococcus saprophyticus]RIM73935.1 transketolase family protein [Staphylococcus arlettae]